jgi:hypothetical protein
MKAQTSRRVGSSAETNGTDLAAANSHSSSWQKSIWFQLAIALIVGFFYALLVMGPRPLNPRNVNWIAFDPAYHYIGWEMFRQDPHVHWPVTYTDRLGYPQGESVALLDLNPLMAVVLKPLSFLLPEPAQYFGLEVILACALQFFFAFRLMRLMTEGAGVRSESEQQIPRGLKAARDDKNKRLTGTAEAVPFQSKVGDRSQQGLKPDSVELGTARLKPRPDTKQLPANILGAALCSVFFLLAPPLNYRFWGHYSLSNQWLLVAALFVFAQAQQQSPRSVRRFVISACVLMAVSVGTNPYLAFQVLLILTAAVVSLCGKSESVWRDRLALWVCWQRSVLWWRTRSVW